MSTIPPVPLVLVSGALTAQTRLASQGLLGEAAVQPAIPQRSPALGACSWPEHSPALCRHPSKSRRPRGRAGTGCSAGPRGPLCSWATCGANCPRRGCRAGTRAQREDRELRGCAAGPALMGRSQQQAGVRPKAGAGQGAAAALQLLLVLLPRSRGVPEPSSATHSAPHRAQPSFRCRHGRKHSGVCARRKRRSATAGPAGSLRGVRTRSLLRGRTPLGILSCN